MWQSFDIRVVKKYYGLSKVPIYGPFYRIESDTQTFETAKKQVASLEMWGRQSRSSNLPAVKAYRKGDHIINSPGIVFVTTVRPHQWPHSSGPIVYWYSDAPDVRSKGGFAIIPAFVIYQNQYDE